MADDNTDDINSKVGRIFEEISDSMVGLEDKVLRIKKDIKEKRLSTSKGLSILEVKNQMLLTYLTNLLYLVLRKCRGKNIAGNPVIERLVEIRTVLERIRPLENKLKYQMDKLMKVASMGGHAKDEPTSFRANPGNMQNHKIGEEDSGSGSENEDGDKQSKNNDVTNSKDGLKSGIYVPPKLVAVHYDEDDKTATKQKKLLERARRHALNSSVMQELGDEYLDTPTEVTQANVFKQKQSRFSKEKQNYEEAYFTRLTVTKKEMHKRRSALGGSNLNGITNFEDVSVLDLAPGQTFTGKKKNKPVKRKANRKKGFKNKRKKSH